MTKKEDLEFDVLTIEGNEIQTRLMDVEGDSIYIEFHPDDSLTIDTEGQTYLILTRDDLNRMIALLDESQDEFESMPEMEEE